MAVTSGWEWISINRSTEESLFYGSRVVKRAWQLTRKRISDAAYSSEDGTMQTSLSGYNGDVTETITCPILPIVTFGTATNWTETTTKWVPSVFAANGYPAYEAYGSKMLLSPPLYVFQIAHATVDYFSGVGVWGVAQSSYVTDAHTWNSTYPVASMETQNTGHAWASIHGKTIAYAKAGAYGVPTTASLNANGQLGFFCTSDVQSYEDRGVDWFVQTQTWTYNEPWQRT